MRSIVALALSGTLVFGLARAAEPLLELVATIPMPGVQGRIDHITIDVKGHRLFVAATGNGTVEVLDLKRNLRASIAGMKEPQGVLYAPDTNRLFVTNGGGNRLDIVDAASLVVRTRVENLEDADNIRHDPVSRKVFVGYGKGAIRILDPENGESSADIFLPGHPESFQVEAGGTRVFVNVPSARRIVVVDRVRRETLAAWETPDAAGNFPMALDEKGRRLFVGARSPAVLLVYDIDTGKVVARSSIGSDADDLFFDPVRKRLYVVCGEGTVDIIHQKTPDRYVLEGSIETAPRARTGLFVGEESRLYVAAPAAGNTPARILVYRIR
jgi:DNA-binding beta-propeller fold protein YncE